MISETKNNKRIKIGLAQINNSFSGQNYLPLSVGMLQAYAEHQLKEPDRYEFLVPIYRRLPVDEAVQKLDGVDIALFSTYVWNYRITLEIARKLKLQCPETVIVLGGPQVPDRVESFLREFTFIDVACHGEGEQTAVAILENYGTKDWHGISGVSFLEEDGSLTTNPKAPRERNLGDDPSPYLQDTFAPLIKAFPEEHWIAMWETNRGCPFSCTFCDWGSAVQSKVLQFDVDRLYREVDWFAQHKIEFVFCCDANFGILPRDLDLANYVASVKSSKGYPNALSVQNTKNATERAYQTQKVLSDSGLNKGVAIALQSMDPDTLASIKRSNISLDTYQELQRRFAREGVETYTDMIIALPGETYESFASGASTVIDNGQHNRIQMTNLVILPNAEMGDPEYQAKYGMESVETKIINIHGSLVEAVDDVAETQMLVISTSSMPKEDWIKTRTYAWTAGLLHFDKVLQIPLIILHQACGISYRELIEAFTESSLESCPVLKEIQEFYVERAMEIQGGGHEYVPSTDWLNIWWPADEYVLIKLCIEGKLDGFYQEAEQVLNALLRKKSIDLDHDLLHQAITLNKSLMKLPFQKEDLYLEVDYNYWETYLAALVGQDVPIEKRTSTYHIDRTSTVWESWDHWCREVIWYGNKKGAYLYGNDVIEPQLEGHY